MRKHCHACASSPLKTKYELGKVLLSTQCLPQRTLEGRCCLLSSSQLLALTTGKAGSGRALLFAAPKNSQRGGGAKGVRQLDRKTYPDRWDRGREPPSNFAAEGFIQSIFFLPSLSLIARTDPLLSKPRRCPNRHCAYSHGPPCGWHLWLLWWCSRYSLPPTLLLLTPLRIRPLQPAGSGRASWRGRWFSWTSTPAARSESWTTTSFLCSWTPRSSKTVGWIFWGRKSFPSCSRHQSVWVSISKMFGGSFNYYAHSHVVWNVMGWSRHVSSSVS